MRLLVLHENKQYLEECAEVLNEEWPRSKTARLHSLGKSNDKFPVNLILVDDKDEAIGHSRLALVIGKDKACFVESVVVKKALRGKGIGKFLMQQTERYAMRAGFSTVYLTTHDKQDFYQHIGYCFCKPIVSCGIQSSNIPQSLLDRLFGTSQEQDTNEKSAEKKVENNVIAVQSNSPSVGISKERSSVPPPPPPPPPVTSVAPNLSISKGSNSDFHPEISKWDPREISWMKKDLM